MIQSKAFATAVSLSPQQPQKRPPTEFRILKAGENTVTKLAPDGSLIKSTLLFDEIAAKAVMEARKTRTVRPAIDYNHDELSDRPGPHPAAGTFDIEVRDGELWAVDVRWTERAAAMLMAGELLYFSPVLAVDANNRVTEVLLGALTNFPAIDQIPALLAAGARAGLYIDQSSECVAGGPAQGATKEKGHEMKTLLTALSLKAEATEAEALEALTRIQDDRRKLDEQLKELVALTGKASFAEAKGAIEAGKQAIATVERQAKELAALKAAETEREVVAMVDKAVADGKLAPAQREWALATGRKDIAVLRGFLDTAPVVALSAREAPAAPRGQAPGSAYARIEQLAATLRQANPSMTREQSIAAVLTTDEGRKLHAEYKQELIG